MQPRDVANHGEEMPAARPPIQALASKPEARDPLVGRGPHQTKNAATALSRAALSVVRRSVSRGASVVARGIFDAATVGTRHILQRAVEALAKCWQRFERRMGAGLAELGSAEATGQ